MERRTTYSAVINPARSHAARNKWSRGLPVGATHFIYQPYPDHHADSGRERGGSHRRSRKKGADDYILKPFSPREVVSRVQAVLRRSQAPVTVATALSDASIRVQGPYFDVSLRGRQLTISDKELAVLRAILPREGELVRAEELTDLLTEENRRIPLEELDDRIRFLRRKLENSGAGTIEILPGFRYRFPSAL